MQIRSIITDYICHIRFIFSHNIICICRKMFSKLIDRINMWLCYRWYVTACKKANKRLSRTLNKKSNKKEYEKEKGKDPKKDNGKYTLDYLDWIEANKGETYKK